MSNALLGSAEAVCDVGMVALVNVAGEMGALGDASFLGDVGGVI